MHKLISLKNSIYGIFSFLLFSISLLIGYDEESGNHLLVLIKAGLICVSAILYIGACRNESSDKTKIQYSILSLILFIYEILLLVAAGKTIIYIRDYPAILNSIMWLSCSFFSIIRFRKHLASFFFRIIHDRNTLILICSSTVLAALVIVLSAEPDGIKFSWDSDTFYGFIYKLDFESLYDAKKLRFYSHVSIVYSHIIVLLKLLFNNIRLAFFIMNALCIITASFGFTFLLNKLIPGRKWFDYSLCSSIFMLSPWVCGMSTYHIYDYYIWCLFPLLILFVHTKRWIWVFIIGVMITFSKATGLVVFGAVCIAVFIMDLISSIKSSPTSRYISVKSTLTRPQYWCFLSVIPVFLLFFRNGIEEFVGISSSTYFGINLNHIVHWVKMILFSNFLWLYILVCGLSVIIIFCNNIKAISSASRKTILIILISDLIFIVFNFIFITYRLPRYLDIHISAVFILEALLLLYINNRIISYVGMCLSMIISVISSYNTVDPLSLKVFNSINVGDHRIIDYDISDHPSLGDSVVYNRDYYSYQVILDKTLTYVLCDKSDDSDILFSLGNDQNTWGLSAGRYSYTYDEGKRDFDLFYDNNIKGLANGYEYEYYNSASMIPFSMKYVFPEETIEKCVSLSTAREFYYIYMPSINTDIQKTIYEKYHLIEENEFIFRGWKMNCIKFRL